MYIEVNKNGNSYNVTPNVAPLGPTPPAWFTNGKDSVPPDTVNNVLFCGDDLQFDTYYLLKEPDGTSTLSELSEYTITSASFLCYMPSSSGDIPCFNVEVENEP